MDIDTLLAKTEHTQAERAEIAAFLDQQGVQNRPARETRNGTTSIPVSDTEMEAIMALAGIDPRTGEAA